MTMIDYLPRYYGDIPVATNIVDREEVELTQLNADIYDILAQMYVDTSTWGLARWERIFGITTDEAKPIDQRRSVIKSRLRGVGTVTPAMIQSMAEAYANGDVEVTEAGTNMLPPFSSGWTLHENTRMRRANYVGKVAGSVVENPHIAYAGGSGPTTLLSPSAFSIEFASGYSSITTLNGTPYATTTTPTNGAIAQQLFSFNLIEHTLRKWGASVFGTAVTTADRVAWLKANLTKFYGNWYGFGSGPAGNKATFTMWNTDTLSYATAGDRHESHTSGTVTKLPAFATTVTIPQSIDANGFVHFLAYADASNGTTASTINTDFVELEVYYAAGSVPIADYELTLEAVGNSHHSDIDIPCLPNTTYTLSCTDNGYIALYNFDSSGTNLGGTAITTNSTTTLTTGATAATIKVRLTNHTAGAGTFTFTNPQLERGSVRTPFENLPDYTVGIKFVSTIGVPANLADLEAAIRDTLPAHLAVEYVFTYITLGNIESYAVTFGAIETAGLTFGALETWEGP